REVDPDDVEPEIVEDGAVTDPASGRIPPPGTGRDASTEATGATADASIGPSTCLHQLSQVCFVTMYVAIFSRSRPFSRRTRTRNISLSSITGPVSPTPSGTWTPQSSNSLPVRSRSASSWAPSVAGPGWLSKPATSA